MKLDTIKEFYLMRKKDVNGISGTGVIARGVILPSGKCVMEWQTIHPTITIFANIDEVKFLHGHEGATDVILGSPLKEKRKRKKSETEVK